MFALQITRSVTSGVSAGDTGRHMGHEYEYIPSEDVASARKTQAKTLPLGDECPSPEPRVGAPLKSQLNRLLSLLSAISINHPSWI